MNAQQLMMRLQSLKNEGADMRQELLIRVSSTVPDKRTRTGYRKKVSYATIDYVCSGSLCIDDTNELWTELSCTPK